jgi:hypothetical protein
MQALLNAVGSLAGGSAEAAGTTDPNVPQLVIIDAFSAVFAPILGRQHMQGRCCSALCHTNALVWQMQVHVCSAFVPLTFAIGI